MFPVRYEHHLHTKTVKLSPLQAVEAHRYVSCEVRTSFTYKNSKAIFVTGRGGP
jgi:hypothetical protein